jgi:hypothetical protein
MATYTIDSCSSSDSEENTWTEVAEEQREDSEENTWTLRGADNWGFGWTSTQQETPNEVHQEDQSEDIHPEQPTFKDTEESPNTEAAKLADMSIHVFEIHINTGPLLGLALLVSVTSALVGFVTHLLYTKI